MSIREQTKKVSLEKISPFGRHSGNWCVFVAPRFPTDLYENGMVLKEKSSGKPLEGKDPVVIVLGDSFLDVRKDLFVLSRAFSSREEALLEIFSSGKIPLEVETDG